MKTQLNSFISSAEQEDEQTTAKDTSQQKGDDDEGAVPGRQRDPSIVMSSKPFGRIFPAKDVENSLRYLISVLLKLVD